MCPLMLISIPNREAAFPAQAFREQSGAQGMSSLLRLHAMTSQANLLKRETLFEKVCWIHLRSDMVDFNVVQKIYEDKSKLRWLI